jgi:hypothetical protein
MPRGSLERGDAMATYRFRFFDDDAAHSMRGQFDFQVGDDVEAVETAEILFDACCDRCQSWEIWEGEVLFVSGPQGIGQRFCASDFAKRRQQSIIGYEQAILDSDWAIASSERLLAELDKLKASRRRASHYA